MAGRSLPDVLLLPVRSARGECPVFQHVRQEGAAGVRDHGGWLSGNVPRGGHGRSQKRGSQTSPPGSGSRDRERRSVALYRASMRKTGGISVDFLWFFSCPNLPVIATCVPRGGMI